jgi:hypothetical protein
MGGGIKWVMDVRADYLKKTNQAATKEAKL